MQKTKLTMRKQNKIIQVDNRTRIFALEVVNQPETLLKLKIIYYLKNKSKCKNTIKGPSESENGCH